MASNSESDYTYEESGTSMNPVVKKMSPLDIEMIITQILNLLPEKDLINCRLVSSQWNKISVRSLKRRCLVIPLGDEPGIRMRNSLEKYNKIAEFVETMKNSFNVPFCAFKFTNISMYNPIMTKFFEVCGIYIKVLVWDTDKSKQCKTDKFIEILKRLSSHLEVLDFDDFSPEISNPTNKLFEGSLVNENEKNTQNCSIKKIIFPAVNGTLCPQLWSEIFRFAVNLETIHINHLDQTAPLFKALEKSDRLKQIKNLRLEDLNKDQLESLLSVNLQLEEFKVNVIGEDVPCKKFDLLLKKLSPNLKVLVLGSPEKNRKIIITLPKMPKLIRLGLFHCDDSLIFLPGLKFCEVTPKLQQLEVSSGIKHLDWQEYLSLNANVNGPPCTTVKELTIALLVYDPQCTHYLGNTFPNVTNLSLEFPRRDFLQAVWTTWDNLTDLTIYFHVTDDDCKDHFLCGIPTEWKTQVKSQCDTTLPDWWKAVDPPSAVNCVCNLKKLQRLTIEESPNSGKESDLTDFSVYFGFVKLRDLRVLKIGRSQITQPAKQFLQESLSMISELDIQDKDGAGLFSLEERDELVSYMKYYDGIDYEQE